MSPTRASAPGKMMLSGEYAVLEGAPAIVAAVQRRAWVEWHESDQGIEAARGLAHAQPRFPEVAAVQAIGGLEGALTVDVSALRGPSVKLGLGSSAAAAAAAAALVSQRTDRATDPSSLLRLALEGHDSVAPEGSGADVAASVFGGTLRYQMSDRSVTTVGWPDGLRAVVVFTGQAASTRDLVSKVKRIESEAPQRYEALMSALSARAIAFADAWASGDVSAVIRATAGYHRGMAELGEAARAPIVEERLACLADLAVAAGGAAKPSGAGGGDVALGLFGDPTHAAAYETLCRGEGFEVLEVELGGPGARVEA